MAQRRSWCSLAPTPDPNPTLEANVNPEPIPGPAAESEDIYCCGYCGGQYEEKTEECKFWIGCETCDCWFHGVCVGIAAGNEPEVYICESGNINKNLFCMSTSSVWVGTGMGIGWGFDLKM